MVMIVDDIILASLIIGAATATTGAAMQHSAQQDQKAANRKNEQAQMRAEAARNRQMKMEAQAARLSEYKKAQQGRARQMALAGAQGQMGSSALEGAIATSTGSGALGTSYQNQSENIGQDIFGANMQRYQAEAASNNAKSNADMGAAIFGAGQTIMSNAQNIGDLGGAAAGKMGYQA